MKKLIFSFLLFFLAIVQSDVLFAQKKGIGYCGANTLPKTTVKPSNFDFTDRFGNTYQSSDLDIPISATQNTLIDQTANDCGCEDQSVNIPTGYFKIYFEDCIYGIQTGFNDPKLGVERKKVLCKIFANISKKIQQQTNPSNCIEKPIVNIQIIPSHLTKPDEYGGKTLANFSSPDVLGFASAEYENRTRCVRWVTLANY